MTKESIEVILLGAAQDAGLPHAGCNCENCVAASEDPGMAELPSSIAVVDRKTKSCWIIDATPALPEQLRLLEQICPGYDLEGFFLTHAHIGHYTGLIYLGREAMDSNSMPVYASPRLCSFLEDNGPWSQLVSLGNICLYPTATDRPVEITAAASIQAVGVVHRAEFSDTYAYTVLGPSRKLFYCPDIDSWEGWPGDLLSFLSDVDYALLDGTFFNAREIDQERLGEVPHPLVEQTVVMLRGVSSEVHFIHMNHTNPLYREGPERRLLADLGFGIGKKGRKWQLEGAGNSPA